MVEALLAGALDPAPPPPATAGEIEDALLLALDDRAPRVARDALRDRLLARRGQREGAR